MNLIVSILFSSLVPPVLDGPLHESLTQNLGSHVTLLCEATGVPVPSITWLKDGTPIGKKLKFYKLTVTNSVLTRSHFNTCINAFE